MMKLNAKAVLEMMSEMDGSDKEDSLYKMEGKMFYETSGKFYEMEYDDEKKCMEMKDGEMDKKDMEEMDGDMEKVDDKEMMKMAQEAYKAKKK